MALPVVHTEPPTAPRGDCGSMGYEWVPVEFLFLDLGVHFSCLHVIVCTLYINSIFMGEACTWWSYAVRAGGPRPGLATYRPRVTLDQSLYPYKPLRPHL